MTTEKTATSIYIKKSTVNYLKRIDNNRISSAVEYLVDLHRSGQLASDGARRYLSAAEVHGTLAAVETALTALHIAAKVATVTDNRTTSEASQLASDGARAAQMAYEEAAFNTPAPTGDAPPKRTQALLSDSLDAPPTQTSEDVSAGRVDPLDKAAPGLLLEGLSVSDYAAIPLAELIASYQWYLDKPSRRKGLSTKQDAALAEYLVEWDEQQLDAMMADEIERDDDDVPLLTDEVDAAEEMGLSGIDNRDLLGIEE